MLVATSHNILMGHSQWLELRNTYLISLLCQARFPIHHSHKSVAPKLILNSSSAKLNKLLRFRRLSVEQPNH